MLALVWFPGGPHGLKSVAAPEGSAVPASGKPPKLPGSTASVQIPSQVGLEAVRLLAADGLSRQPWESGTGHHWAFPVHC